MEGVRPRLHESSTASSAQEGVVQRTRPFGCSVPGFSDMKRISSFCFLAAWIDI